jgi:hypothetical protein
MKVSAILSSALFAATALAAPHSQAGLADRVQRRAASRATRTSNPARINRSADISDGENVTHVDYSGNWAGAVLTTPPAGETFNAVSGQFTVPTPSVPSGGGSGDYSASIWVGIDGDTYGNAIWQAGIDVTISGGEVSFDTWYEWFPNYAINIPNFTISAGDIISIALTSSSDSEGSVVIENTSTGQSVTQSASAPSSSSVLGGQNAEWIVEDFDSNGAQVAFANFGTVLFTNAVASTSSQSVGTDGATIIDIEDSSNNILTSVSLPSSSEVSIVYQ